MSVPRIFRAKTRMKTKRKKPAKGNIKALSLALRRSRKQKGSKSGGKSKGRKKFKALSVSQLQAVFSAPTVVTVTPVDGVSAPIPSPYNVQPGDEFEGDHVAGNAYNLQEGATVVVTVTGDGAGNSDLVQVSDASFFNSVDSYYDEDGQTSFVLDGSDGVIGIRG